MMKAPPDRVGEDELVLFWILMCDIGTTKSISIGDRHDSEKNRELSNVVSNITQSVPNIKVILQQFNWRMIPFVLFMHFVLRCLHRKDHLGSGVYASYPFLIRSDKSKPLNLEFLIEDEEEGDTLSP